MREIITAFIIVFTLQIVTNTPPLPEVQAQTEKPPQASTKAIKKKVVKHATKKRKANTSATVQPPAVSRSVPVAPTGDCTDWIRAAGVKDVSNAYQLIMRESGCRVSADNPTSDAYGIPQSLPGSKMASHGADWATNPVTQIRWMQDYVNARYGGFAQANAFQLANNWY